MVSKRELIWVGREEERKEEEQKEEEEEEEEEEAKNGMDSIMELVWKLLGYGLLGFSMDISFFPFIGFC